MALLKKLRNLRTDTTTGFGTNSSSTGGRFVNKDGNANVIKKGVDFLNRYSWYHTMLGMSRARFIFLLFFSYIIINLVFAGIYYLIGTDHIAGVHAGSPLKNFTEVFFFSAQTFTTVGYGRISPVGFFASAVSTFEAFLGLLSFALATGLFYGRFSRPRSFLKFSENALIAPYQDGTALMFRLAPYKNNKLSEVEVKLTMAITVEEDGKLLDSFYTLDMEMSKINGLALSWTIVHPITETSPFYGLTKVDISAADMEIMVFVKGFDEVFSNNVVSRTSYISSEIIWGAKFNIMYHPNGDKSKTILDLQKINDYKETPLPETMIVLNSAQ